MNDIAATIATQRKAKGWSQTDLAHHSGVSREMIGRYERARAVPSVDAAKKIADAFGVSLDYLVGEGINAAFDKRTVRRLQDIEQLDPHTKDRLLDIVDAVIRDYKTRKAYAA